MSRLHLLTASLCWPFLLAGVARGDAAPKWPDCSVRTIHDGGPAIVVDGKLLPPMALSLNNQFQRDELLLDEVRLAHAAGLDLIVFHVRLEWYQSSEDAAAVVEKFCSANPDAYFILGMWLGANDAWRREHPDDVVTKADGTQTYLVSPSSPAWRREASELMRRRIGETINGPHGDRFIGVEMAYMNTAEWFYFDANDFQDYSPVNRQAFREWLGATHGSDAALREAWGDPNVTLATAEIPSAKARDAVEWGPFRHPVRHRPAMDFQRFQNELVSDTIAFFAHAVKEETQGRSLVSAHYGYTIELLGNGPRALTNSGHLGLARLLESPDIDIIRSPYSYFDRKIGQPAHLHSPADSIALHGKLSVSEDDTFTHLAEKPAPHLMAPGWNARTTTLDETLSAMRRNFGMFATHGAGIYYLDLLSEGRWRDPAIWECAAQLRDLRIDARDAKPFLPEVAFIVDENSPHLLGANLYPYFMHGVYWWRHEIDRLGAPVGYYLQSDLERLPPSVKVMILATPYEVTDAQRQAVEERVAAGAIAVWVRAPGISGPDGPDPKRIGALTGIEVEARFDDEPSLIICEPNGQIVDFETNAPKPWKPRFVVTSPDVEVLARYQSTHDVAAASRSHGAGAHVYTAFPRLPVPLLRQLCERAGVHLYRDTPGMTAVVGDYLFVHTDGAETHELRWPTPCARIERIVPAAAKPLAHNTNVWRDALPAGTTAIYRCTPGSDASLPSPF